MAHKLSEVTFDQASLIQPSYTAKDMIGKSFTINSLEVVNGEKGVYVKCDITGDGLEPGRKFTCGGQNVVVKLMAAMNENLLPLDVTVVKNGNAFDIQ